MGRAEFAALLDRLGPFGARPVLAAAVSGGADSMALALLAAGWVRDRGGRMVALVVDHRLRPGSGDEAELTVRRLADCGIPGRILVLDGLHHGPALAARARDARLAVLAAACVAAGITDLLLGHHAADQAETLMMRALGGTDAAGFAGMATQRETESLRLLRPLLTVDPQRLRATLLAAKVAWVEDPSNADRKALRGRLRALRGVGDGPALHEAASVAGAARAEHEAEIAEILACRASLFPEGYALLTPGAVPPAALAALLRTISGARYPISSQRVAALAWSPVPATLAGVRLLPAGAYGPGLLVVREAAAQAGPVPAVAGAVWDGRFRLDSAALSGATLGALGADGARWRRILPSAVLMTLPAIRRDGALVAVPHFGYNAASGPLPRVSFAPAHPVAGAPFLAARGETGVMCHAT